LDTPGQAGVKFLSKSTTAVTSQTSLCQQDVTTTLAMQEMTALAMEMFSTTTLVVKLTATCP